jgi:transcriptional regulator GlxA family with amidase domain
MDDEHVLGWIREQAAGVRCLFSVCTGALICGEAGMPSRAIRSIHGTFQGTARAFQQSLAHQPLLIAAALLAVMVVESSA